MWNWTTFLGALRWDIGNWEDFTCEVHNVVRWGGHKRCMTRFPGYYILYGHTSASELCLYLSGMSSDECERALSSYYKSLKYLVPGTQAIGP